MSRTRQIIAEELKAAKARHRPVKKWKSEATSPVPSNNTQMERIIDAIVRHREAETGKKVRASLLRELAEPYGRRAAGELLATNPYAQDLITKTLLSVIKEFGGGKEMVAVTLYHPGLDRPSPESLKGIRAGYLEYLIKSGRSEMRKAFQGASYIACFELAIFRVNKAGEPSSARFEVRPHHHAIVFLRREALDSILERRFPDPYTGAGGSMVYKVEEITNLENWVRYMTKDPRCRYRDVQQLNRNSVREKWSAAQQMMVLQMYGDLAKTQLFTASGLGKDILKAVGGSRRLPRKGN
jgi:hypothetical protein